jgi:hypothetical protein
MATFALQLSQYPEFIINSFLYSPEDAVMENNLKKLDWIHKNVNKATTENVEQACCFGTTIEILEWFEQNSILFGDRVLNMAIECGNNNIIEWLDKNKPDIHCDSSALLVCGQYGYEDILEWLYENRAECRGEEGYYLRALEYLHEHYDDDDW